MANVPFPEIEMSVPALMMVSLPSGATPEGSVIVPPPSLKVMSFPIMDIVWNSLVESVSPVFEIIFPVSVELMGRVNYNFSWDGIGVR